MKNDLNLQCPINSLSYGLVSLNIVRGLSKHRKISLFPIGPIQLERKEDQPLIQELVNNQASLDIYATSLRIYHQFDLVQRIGCGTHIGWPIFELNKFSDREKLNLVSCDKLIVCSEWARQIISKELPAIEVSVVPLGVDRNIFFEDTSPWNYPYTFISVGKIEVRKGYDLLPKLFAKALPKGGPWKLHMLWGNPFLPEDEKKQWKSYYRSILGNNVSFCDRLGTQSDIAREMRFADCGITMSRAEGWNLPLLELMSCGKPVIATNYSAHTEFCTNDNSDLINITELETAADGKWFDGKTGEWAKLGPDQEELAIEYIRARFYKGKGDINENGIETAKKFSWQNTVDELLKVVG